MRSKGPEIRRLLRARIRTRPRTCAELAKIYGSDSSSRFINGVLGALVDHQEEIKQQFSSH